MASLLSDADKASLFNSLHDVWETYARPLTVYQEAQRTVINSNPNFNPIEAWDQNNTDIQNTPVYSTISGCIQWDKQQEWKYVMPGGYRSEAQLKIKDQTTQACRLKVDYSGYQLLLTAKKVDIDGIPMNLESEPRPHGAFGTGIWTFYFVRSN